MLRTEEKEISGVVYVVTTLPMTQGVEVFGRLAPLFTLAAATGDMGRAAAKSIQEMQAADILHVSKVFAEHTTLRFPDGREPVLKNVMEAHFSGDYLPMFEWIAFCIKVNYESFFVGLVAKLQTLKAIKPTDGTPTKSP